MTERKSVWVTASLPQRFFLIPEDHSLRRGALKIRDSAGLRFASVDPDDAATCEVSVREARKWSEAHREEAEAEAQRRREALERTRRSVEQTTAALATAFGSPEAREWAARFGLDAARLIADPEATWRLGIELRDVVRSPGPDAEQRVREVLGRHGHPGATPADIAGATRDLETWLKRLLDPPRPSPTTGDDPPG